MPILKEEFLQLHLFILFLEQKNHTFYTTLYNSTLVVHYIIWD